MMENRPPTTVAQTISEAAQLLGSSGIANERLTASLLLAYTLGVNLIYIITHPDEQLTEEAQARFWELVKRRAGGEPFQYIIGGQEFYGRDFIVTPDVLIPRPETELIIEQALKHNRAPSPLIIDIGTGSGCIAVTLACEIATAKVIALDISEPALAVAQRNADLNKVSDRVTFLPSDCFSALASDSGREKADLIVSNPPYVAEKDLPGLQREVRDFEPRAALTPGPDELIFYRKLLNESPDHLKPGGLLIFEMGYKQFPQIETMINTQRWEIVEVARDLRGFHRVLSLRLRK